MLRSARLSGLLGKGPALRRLSSRLLHTGSPMSSASSASFHAGSPMSSASFRAGLQPTPPLSTSTIGCFGRRYISTSSAASTGSEVSTAEEVVEHFLTQTDATVVAVNAIVVPPLTSTRAEFRFMSTSSNSSPVLEPGEWVRVPVPDDLGPMQLTFLGLIHRGLGGSLPEGAWDNEPGLTTLLVGADGHPHLIAIRGNFPPSGSTYYPKYAERGHDEREGMRYSAKTGAVYIGPDGNILGTVDGEIDGVRILLVGSVGKSPVKVIGCSLEVLPKFPDNAFSVQAVFSNGAAFGDFRKGSCTVPNKHAKGLLLGGSGASQTALPEGFQSEFGRLTYTSPEAVRVVYVRVLIGDWFEGKSGFATLWVNAGDQPVIANANVPPAGLISGSPQDPSQVLAKGDKVIIGVNAHRAQVFGVEIVVEPVD